MTFGEVLIQGLSFFWSPAMVGFALCVLMIVAFGHALVASAEYSWPGIVLAWILVIAMMYITVCFYVWVSTAGIPALGWTPVG